MKYSVMSVDGVVARAYVYDADRCVLSPDAGAAAATATATSPVPVAAISTSSPVSVVSSSSTAFVRPSRQLRRFDSLPAYDVTGHVILSSTRLVEKLTATLNALTIDCRQPGARNHGNGVAVTSDLYDVSGATSPSDSAAAQARNAAENNNFTKLDKMGNIVFNEPGRLVDICQNVITSSQPEEHISAEIESLRRLESAAPLSDITVAESVTDATPSVPGPQQEDEGENAADRQCSNRRAMTVMLDVVLDKGPLGLGFCIDGGLDAPAGPAPITVKRLFKGTRGPLKLNPA